MSFRVVLIKSISSKQMMIHRQSFLWREIGIFINFVKILGAENRLKNGHRNSYRFTFRWSFTYFWSFLLVVLQNMRLLRLSCILSLLKEAFLLTGRDPPFWSEHMGLICSTLSCWWSVSFPHPFFTIKTDCLKIDLLIYLPKKWPLPQHFLCFLDHQPCFVCSFAICIRFGGLIFFLYYKWKR